MKSFNISEPPSTPFQFEPILNRETVRKFLENNWHYSIYISVFYLVTIYLLREYMKSRPAFHLQTASVIWNGILAVFSICVAIRGIPVFYFIFTRYPFYYIVCDKMVFLQMPHFIFWGALFTFSKVWELGDTILIVLRKGKLMFLHCYHHVTILLIIWYGAYREASVGVLLMFYNSIVHSVMYSYFTFKCMNVKIPVKVAMFITAVQTLQMLNGFLLSCWIYWLHLNGYECDVPIDCLHYIFIIGLTYLILFAYLFYENYIRCKVSKKKKD